MNMAHFVFRTTRRKCYLSLVCMMCPMLSLHAQFIQTDSLLTHIEQQIDSIERAQRVTLEVMKYEDKLLKKEMSFNYLDGIPLVRGLILASTNHSFNRQNIQYKKTDYEMRDYVPAALPLATAWTLKALGVESRSHTRRMFTANLIGLSISCGTTYLLKHNINQWRPNRKDDHSFPSGHSSFAFLSAAILHREFGHHSPWITVGGYTTALTTEVLRLHHNDHFINDVFTGAGIGLISANIGYYLTDRIYGANAINRPRLYQGDIVRLGRFLERPTTLALVSGTDFGSQRIHDDGFVLHPANADGMTDFAGKASVKAASTLSVGLEYTYAFTSRWAADVEARLTSTHIYADFPSGTTNTSLCPSDVQGEMLCQYHATAALKYSVPFGFTKRLSLRAKAGDCFIPETKLVRLSDRSPFITIPRSHHFEIGTGIGFDAIDNDNYVIGFSVEYLRTFSPIMPNRCNLGSDWRILL